MIRKINNDVFNNDTVYTLKNSFKQRFAIRTRQTKQARSWDRKNTSCVHDDNDDHLTNIQQIPFQRRHVLKYRRVITAKRYA